MHKKALPDITSTKTALPGSAVFCVWSHSRCRILDCEYQPVWTAPLVCIKAL